MEGEKHVANFKRGVRPIRKKKTQEKREGGRYTGKGKITR